MSTPSLDPALQGTSWTLRQEATLLVSSPEKFGPMSLSGKMPANDALLDFANQTMALTLEVAKFDTGNFLINVPLRKAISGNLGSHAQWRADATSVEVTGMHTITVAGTVEFGHDTLHIPATIEFADVDAEGVTAAFSARYVFPHVKLPVPGVPEMWDVPIDLNGTLELVRLD